VDPVNNFTVCFFFKVWA